MSPNPRVFLDSNVLFKFYLRTLLLTMATERLLYLHWSKDVLQEVCENIKLKIPAKSREITKTILRLSDTFPGAEINNYNHLIGSFGCRDTKDEHVLAAATVGHCDYLLTFNIKDFPERSSVGPVILTPDDFLQLYALANPTKALKTILSWAGRFRNPSLYSTELVEILENAECPGFSKWVSSNAAKIDRKLSH